MPGSDSLATHYRKVGLEVSTQKGWIRGRAAFGTWRGLEARGNGTLAGVRDAPGVFEFGRDRNEPLHQLEGEHQSVLFCRRAEAERYGREIELVGAIAPAKDSQGRCGFFGACLATNVDRLQPHSFGNWEGGASEIADYFREVKDSFLNGGQGSFLRHHFVSPTGHDERLPWVSTTNEVLLLHCDVGDESNWNTKVFEYMQAIAFKYGTHHPTIMVFQNAVAGSQPLISNRFEKHVRGLRKAKAERPPPGDVAPIRSDASVELEEPAPASLIWERVNQLERQVAQLEKIVESQTSRVVAPVMSQLEDEATTIPLPVYVLAALGGGALVGIVLFAVYFGLFG